MKEQKMIVVANINNDFISRKYYYIFLYIFFV